MTTNAIVNQLAAIRRLNAMSLATLPASLQRQRSHPNSGGARQHPSQNLGERFIRLKVIRSSN
jgi:hypothetical protein